MVHNLLVVTLPLHCCCPMIETASNQLVKRHVYRVTVMFARGFHPEQHYDCIYMFVSRLRSTWDATHKLRLDCSYNSRAICASLRVIFFHDIIGIGC